VMASCDVMPLISAMKTMVAVTTMQPVSTQDPAAAIASATPGSRVQVSKDHASLSTNVRMVTTEDAANMQSANLLAPGRGHACVLRATQAMAPVVKRLILVRTMVDVRPWLLALVKGLAVANAAAHLTTSVKKRVWYALPLIIVRNHLLAMPMLIAVALLVVATAHAMRVSVEMVRCARKSTGVRRVGVVKIQSVFHPRMALHLTLTAAQPDQLVSAWMAMTEMPVKAVNL